MSTSISGARADGWAFDELARGYDSDFTDTALGALLRGVVHDVLLETFRPGDRVVDLGCGTGADAAVLSSRGIRVHGIDRSSRMIDTARARNARNGAVFEAADLSESALGGAPFDGAYSSFGAINCIADRRRLGSRLAASLSPGARIVLTVMGPFCPWEWIWYGLRGDFRTAFRRIRGGAQFRGVEVYYPTPAELARELRPAFEVVRVLGLGFLLPPTYARHVVERRPRLMRTLARAESWTRRTPPARWLGDHYVIELERR